MRPRKAILYFSLPLLLFQLFSCMTQEKIADRKQKMTVIDSQLLVHHEKLDDLDEKRLKKQTDNEMSDSVSSGIKKFIDKTSNEIKKLVADNSVMIADYEVDRNDWNRLKKLLSVSKATEKLIDNKVALLNDLINRNTVVKLDQDVIFEPGQYNVSPSMTKTIGNFFNPAIKEIEEFMKKYPDFPLSLVITAKGYADATPIAEGSALFFELKDELKLSGKDNITHEDLNKALSNKRAKSVIDLFKTFTKGKTRIRKNNKIIYLYQGKGEALPDPKITDYKINDPRRRLVLLFWGVFPD